MFLIYNLESYKLKFYVVEHKTQRDWSVTVATVKPVTYIKVAD